MRIAIRKKNIEITSALKEYIEKKIIEPVEKLLKRSIDDNLPVLDIEMSRTTSHHRKGMVYAAEATLSMGKKVLRAEVQDEDMRVCCDLLKEELEREIGTYKNKIRALTKRRARRMKRELHFDPAAKLNEGRRMREEGM